MAQSVQVWKWSPRVGLVLSGGGGKGAYQVGCVKALRKALHEAGIAGLSAISGVSVGSLNGILVAVDRDEAAAKLWTDIHWSKVIGFEPTKAVLLPLWALCAFYRLRFGAPPQRRHPDRTMRWMSWVMLAWVPILGIYFLTGGWLVSWQRHVEALKLLWRQSPELWIWLVGLGLLGVAGELVPRVVLHLMVTTNRPLATFLERELTEEDLGRVRCHVYATLSRPRPWAYSSMDWSGWVPEYVRLDGRSRASVLEVLIQSAGLPGVFRARKALGEKAIDGGFTDNTPVAPLLFDQDPPLDVLFVIYLSPRGADYEAPVDAGRRRWIAYKQASLGEQRARQIDRDFMDLKTGPYDPIPKNIVFPRIIEVFPSKSLGNFVTGTLNFRAEKARELIAQGEREMDDVLRREQLTTPLAWHVACEVSGRGGGV